MNARKAHNTGRNHISNVRDYFASLGHDTAQSIIDQIIQSHENGGRAAMMAAPSMRLGAGFMNPMGPGMPAFSEPLFFCWARSSGSVSQTGWRHKWKGASQCIIGDSKGDQADLSWRLLACPIRRDAESRIAAWKKAISFSTSPWCYRSSKCLPPS